MKRDEVAKEGRVGKVEGGRGQVWGGEGVAEGAKRANTLAERCPKQLEDRHMAQTHMQQGLTPVQKCYVMRQGGAQERQRRGGGCGAWGKTIVAQGCLTCGLHRVVWQDLHQGGSSAMLQGTMEDDKGLLGHGRVHEGMYPPHWPQPLLQIFPPLQRRHELVIG